MAEAKTPTTPYRSRRMALGWSREHAAEKIGVSDDKLERIENGKQRPNPQDVLIMSEVYQAPELCNFYCSTDCEIGKRYVPRVPDSELPGIILHLLDSVYEVEDIEKSLVRITADDVIDESEVESLADAQYTLERLSVMVEALQLCIERKISRGEISRDAYCAAYEKAERRKR
ncbi:MAG: helix-turn-helix domain-containing protein [Firmicutes bacterium]|nr:helix-turn-helix domain-containing protein [Bacillota bacterium]